MLFLVLWQRFLVVHCILLRLHPATSLSKRSVKAVRRWNDASASIATVTAANIKKQGFVVPFLRGGSFLLDSRGGSTEMISNDSNTNEDHNLRHPTQLILIIDVDNTLYNEQLLRSSVGLGIEEQIIQNTFKFFKDYLNATSERPHELYYQYGSAIEGLRHEYWQNCNELEMEQWMQRCYHDVYDDIDVSGLYHNKRPNRIQQKDGSSEIDEEITTGYSHGNSHDLLRLYLEGLSSHPQVQLYVASNSPKLHVDKVLRALGLNRIAWTGILTPDTIVVENTTSTSLSYPTKHNPRQFFHDVLQQQEQSVGALHQEKIVILDDSLYNLRRAKEEIGFDGIHIQHNVEDDHQPLAVVSALHQALSAMYVDGDRSRSYAFDDINYLGTKNVVDRVSINRNVKDRLAHELAQTLLASLPVVGSNDDSALVQDQLCIVDLGAGLLSTLEMFMTPSNDNEQAQSSFFQTIQDLTKRPLQRVVYYAYESNQALFEECRSTLARLGFEPVPDVVDNGNHSVFRRQQNLDITVYLKSVDFRHERKDESMPTPQLIVGCCFADLFQPQELVPPLFGFLSRISKQSAPLLYFPITFAGSTQFVPPNPFESSPEQHGAPSIPSDTTAFSYYARALQELGHNLDPTLLIAEMERYGVELIDSGPSPWKIDPAQHEYLWRTMMHFFARTGAPAMLQQGWDAFGWLRRAFVKRPKIVVSNVDLLFRIPAIQGKVNGSVESCSSASGKGSNMIEEIQFVAPRSVTTIRKETEATLLPNQIRVQSVCSLISSGTELKIFQGMFSEDVLDVNIKGMSDQTMSYPLAYGYSMVGRIVECGSDVVNAKDMMGRLVFSFSPHATGMILDWDSVHLVPDGISAEDAMFMPSVETALSIVHDAHVRIGENVAVYGQGLIGLLVTSILSLQKLGPDKASGKFGTITAFDTLTDRLAASGMLGASQALLPSEASIAGPFDVSIEVSGNPRALQSAIDNTSDGGRIVVASWYGNAQVTLKLGMDFHRSHKTIQTSQVSELPAELTGLWSKQRRFALTWELVKQIRPSRLVTKRTTLDKAQEAYEALGTGTEIAVAFDYEKR